MPRPTILEEITNVEEDARTYTNNEIDSYMVVSDVEPTNDASLWMKVISS